MADGSETRSTSLAGLFPILRQIRIRAGVTQKQVAQATGAGGRHGHKLIARLEAGHVSNPSARLVLDYLRACGATSTDIQGFLDGYLSVRLSAPERPQRGPARALARGPRVPKPQPEDAATLALRKEAAWWNLRKVIEIVLHRELNGLGANPMSKERKHAADFGRKVFRILYQTRQARPALRERRLGRCRAWAERKALPHEALDHLLRTMTALFDDMAAKDELDWLPPADDAKHLMLLRPRHRLQTDYDMCRDEYLERMAREQEAREAARKPVIEAAMNLLKSAGLSGGALGNYLIFITAFLNVAESTQPGSPQRTQRIEEVIHSMERPYIDQSLLRRLAELVLPLRDGRA
ncbi:MAG: helix-turn-helix transcriptional regulator [candidate division WOR-3 bacterium]|nr:helix-turn-helix transcriptional regulator [candidate division WOR-3 bacterium]